MNKKNPKVSVVYDYKHEGNDALGIPGTVWVRIYESRQKRRYISTGVRVLPSQWSDTYHVIKREDAVQLNEIIEKQCCKCNQIISESLASATIPELPTTVQMKVDKSDASFLDWLTEKIDDSDLSAGTVKNHRKVLKNLEEYGKIRRFEHITPTKLRAWIDDVKKKGISQVSLYDYWKCLRKWLYVAIDERKIPPTAILGVKVARGKSKERERLTDEEIDRWVNTPMPKPYMADARDRFIVQMGTGLAYSDLMGKDFTRCENINGNVVLSGRREKNDETFFLVVLPMAVKVLERWNWKVPPISMTNYNEFLKDVAKWCQIDKRITSHVARHTYACYCLRHGVRIEAVQKTLGHTQISTTQIYARLADMDVLSAFENLSKTKKRRK